MILCSLYVGRAEVCLSVFLYYVFLWGYLTFIATVCVSILFLHRDRGRKGVLISLSVCALTAHCVKLEACLLTS